MLKIGGREDRVLRHEKSYLKDEEWGLYLRREGLYSTQIEEWRTLMENALPWNKKPVKDARDTKIKQLEHEILRKGLSWIISVACSQKKSEFSLGRKQGRGAKTELRDRTAILDLMKECEPVQARPVAFLGIDERTIQRWKLSKLREDCRKGPLSSFFVFSRRTSGYFKSGNKLPNFATRAPDR